MNTPLLIMGQQAYLQELQVKDILDNYVAWLNIPEANQYLESRYQQQTIFSCIEFISGLPLQGNNCMWRIYFKTNHVYIGNIKLSPINALYKRVTIGLMVGNKDFWGRGIVTEVIKLVSNFVFTTLYLYKVNADCYESNVASRATFLKAGYQIEGRLKDYYILSDHYEDCLLLGKVSDQISKDS